MNNIILIGMPGVGKSSIGVVLAKYLGMDFTDCDLVIQSQTGKTLKEIISELGPDGFTKLENKINSGIFAENTVIATGGSAVYGEDAMLHFKQIGTVVYLAVKFKDLCERIKDMDARGVVHREGQTLRDIYDERRPLYKKYADVTVFEKGSEFNIGDTIKSISDAVRKYRGTK